MRPDDAGGGADERRELFDLAVERALTYLERARPARGGDAPALRASLEVWYLRTRFASRIPLESIVDALLALPDGGARAWRWRGGRDGAWAPRRR